MSAPIPLRQDFEASQLRGLARRSKDGPQARRLLALAAIYDGATRTEAAKLAGVGLQIIRDWVLRFNARGPDALVNGSPPVTFSHSCRMASARGSTSIKTPKALATQSEVMSSWSVRCPQS
jgi:Winged helix-turn helix